MTIEEFNQKLLEAEEKFNFFDVEIFGKKIWGLLRFNYYLLDEVYADNDGISYNMDLFPKCNFFELIIKHLNNPGYDFLFRDLPCFLSQKDILYITEKYDIKYNTGRERKKVIEDYILSTPDNISYAILEYALSEGSYINFDMFKDKYYFSHEMLTALYKNNYNISREEVSSILLDKIILPLEKFFNKPIVDRVRILMIDICMFYILYSDIYNSFFSYILKKVKPKLVIFTEIYFITPILVEALRNQNIISANITFMYILVDEKYIGYSSNLKFNRYNPDYVICKGEIERDWFAKETHECKYGISKKNLLPIGNLSLNERFLRAKKSKYPFNEIKRYLVISSGFNKLKEFTLKLSKSLQEEKIEIIYKLHPLEFHKINEFIQYFKNTNVKIKADVSIYNLIETADLIIGEESNAIYESARFYKPIFIYNRFYKTHPLVKHNIATGISSVDDFLNKIKNPEKMTTTPENISYFYADNAKENYQNFLREVIGKNNHSTIYS